MESKLSDVSKTIPELIAEARGVRKKFHAAQLSDSRYLEEDELAKLDAAGYLAVVVANHLADALESATRVSAIDPAMIERFKTGWNAANNMDLFGGRVHAGLVAALDGAPERDPYDDFCPTCDSPKPGHTEACAVPFRRHSPALEGAPEPKWEYRVLGDYYTYDDLARLRGDWRSPDVAIVRRPVFPWSPLPVEGESE